MKIRGKHKTHYRRGFLYHIGRSYIYGSLQEVYAKVDAFGDSGGPVA
jgi:hypothetical protein